MSEDRECELCGGLGYVQHRPLTCDTDSKAERMDALIMARTKCPCQDREQPIEPGQVWRHKTAGCGGSAVMQVNGPYVQLRCPKYLRPYWITITLLDRDYTLEPQAGRGVVDRMEPRK